MKLKQLFISGSSGPAAPILLKIAGAIVARRRLTNIFATKRNERLNSVPYRAVMNDLGWLDGPTCALYDTEETNVLAITGGP
jgi:hypothetical protein